MRQPQHAGETAQHKEKKMTIKTSYVEVWYDLSGLASYGMSHDGHVARRGYVLIEGRNRNVERRTDWVPIGSLTGSQHREALAIKERGKDPTMFIKLSLVENGSMMPTLGMCGGTVVVADDGTCPDDQRAEYVARMRKLVAKYC
jgi:hypothetical protein